MTVGGFAKKPPRFGATPRTPSGVMDAFNSLRPATASSGIGGVAEAEKYSLGRTLYAGAGSPIKLDRDNVK